MKQLFKYIEPLWLGRNGKMSIRRVLALCFSLDFMRNLSHIIHTWELGKSYADVAMLLGLEAGLIAALLALTTYSQNIPQVNNSSQNISSVEASD